MSQREGRGGAGGTDVDVGKRWEVHGVMIGEVVGVDDVDGVTCGGRGGGSGGGSGGGGGSGDKE